jgi:hypothetical protein
MTKLDELTALTKDDWLKVELLLGVSDLDFDVCGQRQSAGCATRYTLSCLMLRKLSARVRWLQGDNKRLRMKLAEKE